MIKYDVKINRNKLDIEWSNLPFEIDELSKIADIGQDELDRLKLDLEIKEAELHHKISQNPEEYTGGKSTVDAIKNAIIRNEERIELCKKYLDKKEEITIIRTAITSLDRKARSLKYLTELWIRNYFSEPSLSDEAEKILGEKERKRVSDKIKKKLNRPK